MLTVVVVQLHQTHNPHDDDLTLDIHALAVSVNEHWPDHILIALVVNLALPGGAMPDPDLILTIVQ